MKPQIIQIFVTEYQFPSDTNPFAFDAQSKNTVTAIAQAIVGSVEKLAKDSSLIRGIQSGKHDLGRDELIESIIRNGSDGNSEIVNEKGVLFAAPYYGMQTIETILSGFHEFKPKCEERPQYPVDIWMIYNQAAFENITYLHARHNVIANDKWQMRKKEFSELMGIVIVN